MAQSVPMRKLRDLYSQTQRNASQNFDKVTQQRMKKILAFANKQYENMLNNNDFTYLDEIVFYRDKFQEIVNVFNVSIQQGYKKPRVKAEITAILKGNFSQEQVGEFNYAAHENSAGGQKVRGTIEVESPLPQKEVIQSYFDSKKEEIQRSKVGFKSVIEGIPYIPKKYAVKQPVQKKVADVPPPPPPPPVPNRDGEIKALQDEIARLKKEFADQQGQKDFRLGILQQQRRQYEQRIKQLSRQLQHIQNENIILKEQSAKNYPISTQPYYAPVINEEPQELEYNPYQIKFRENDINKIKNKVTARQPNKFIQLPAKSHNPFIKEESEQYDKKSNHFEIINQLDINQDGLKRKDSFSALNTSNYRSNQSGIKNQLNHIALKSKISFFKNSMILYKGDQFEIAVRCTDLVRLTSKKISLFVNNKSKSTQMVNFQYKFDPSYYEITTTRKLKSLQRNSQGKQEVEVKLINEFDLDSLIQVQLAINDRNIIFLLPALFIEFLEKRPEHEREVKYETQKIIPIHQFANLLSAEQFIPLQKLYGQYQQAGRVYAISKAHQGYIYFKWAGGLVQIKTIPAWKLLFGYLILREY